MRLIGDVHGKINEYLKLTQCPASIQLGDMGLGFKGVTLPTLPFSHVFIRGNHDSPQVCKHHPSYAGDYGYAVIKDGLINFDFFYVSGAMSIDRHLRIEGASWWPDEELSYPQLNEVIGYFEGSKPDVMVSHDCPLEISRFLNFGNLYRSITSNALQSMFELHKPKLWVFGHHHIHFDKNILGTRFVCLPELGVLDI